MVETQGEETESSDYDVAGEMQLSINYNLSIMLSHY
jgi:hypothetical protein